MARVLTNVRRVKKDIEDTQGRYTLRTRALARKLGAAGRDNIRANIAPPRFPGYAMTGLLKRKVVSSEPKKVGAGWQAVIRVQLTGRVRKYALIHETGGRIPITNPAQIRAMFASLRKHGQLRSGRAGSRRRLRFIRIKPKWYFRDGIEKTRREWTLNKLKAEF